MNLGSWHRRRIFKKDAGIEIKRGDEFRLHMLLPLLGDFSNALNMVVETYPSGQDLN